VKVELKCFVKKLLSFSMQPIRISNTGNLGTNSKLYKFISTPRIHRYDKTAIEPFKLWVTLSSKTNAKLPKYTATYDGFNSIHSLFIAVTDAANGTSILLKAAQLPNQSWNSLFN
jgi:hypothetical protein